MATPHAPTLALLLENHFDLQLALDDALNTFDACDARQVERLAELSDDYRDTLALLARHELHEVAR